MPPVPSNLATQVLIREAGSKLNRDELTRLVRVYETILANTDDFVYIFDPQGRFLYANARLLKVWARTLDQVIGKTCHELGYPQWHADMHMREIEQIVRDKTPIRSEVPFTGDSGISGIYDYIFKPVLDAQGEVEMIVGTTRDVTDASRAHARTGFLSQLSQKLSTATDEAGINCITTAELGRFLGAPRAYCFQLLPGTPRVRVLPDWRAGEEAPLAGDYDLANFGSPEFVAALRSGTVAIGDVRTDPLTVTHAAHYLPLQIVSFAFAPFIHEGKWVASIGVACDQPRRWLDDEKILLENVAARVCPLIERARAEAALHEANRQLNDRAAHLEVIVQQRTHKLSEIIGELEAFSYSISHDMRSPLRSMIGFSEILLEEYGPRFDAQGTDYLTRIARAGQRMDRLIQDVLGFSRLSSSEVVLQPVKTGQLIHDVVRAYPNLQAANVAITVSPDLPAVRANEALLTQCVSNLLENAVKFANPGQKAFITISSTSEGGRTRLSFRDDGIGIPEHSLNRIFDIFQRVGRSGDGTGIGLAIVRKAVEKMGGQVGVQSRLGHGSLFWLELETA